MRALTQNPWQIEAETAPEEDALREIRQGNSEPLGVVLEGYRMRLERMLRLRLSPQLMGRVAVSDVLQDAYIEAAQRLPKYLEGDSSTGERKRMPLFLWVRFLAGQQLTKAFRFHLGASARDARRDQSLVVGGVPGASSVHLASAIADSGVSPSGAASTNEVRELLAEALEALEETDREILMLRHFEQLPNKDIAHLLGLSESGASLRHLRAMQRMQSARACGPASVGSSSASAEPIVGKRVAAASASITSDLPEPFSPTKKVAGVRKRKACAVASAG